jgi:hypothetical protein
LIARGSSNDRDQAAGLIGSGAASLALADRLAFAQDKVKSGTVEIEHLQVAFIGSGNAGRRHAQFSRARATASPWAGSASAGGRDGMAPDCARIRQAARRHDVAEHQRHRRLA